MPKRKRDGFGSSGDRVQDMRKTGVEEKLVHSKKLVHKALKTSKGLYRQKLGKKVTQAKAKAELDELPRLEREIVALKGLDLDKSTDVLLYKTLLKSDAIAGSDLLPEYVKAPIPKPEGSEEELHAFHNVVSGVYNMKIVRDVLGQAVNGMYIAMGIPAPAPNAKGKKSNKKEPTKGILKESGSRQSTGHAREAVEDEAELSWEGFGSDAEDQGGYDSQEDQGDQDDSDLDSEELSRYDALLGGSSDEESIDINLPRSTLSLRDLSITPSPSASPEPEAAAKKARSSKPARKETPRVGGSTFLPTLMGGYWSGSESSASELSDDEMIRAPPVKKNRKGQMERRLIAQKKFGANANHVKKGLGLKGQSAPAQAQDDGWDAKRGARDSNERGRGRGRGSGRGSGSGRGRGMQRNFEQVTGENAIAVQPRKRGLGRKDDAGPLHESWMAAKKAKEMQKTASFQGKKVTFD